jgi:hypothetical protein
MFLHLSFFSSIYLHMTLLRIYRACGLRLRHWKAQRRKTSEDTEGISLARLLWWRPGGADNAGRDLSPKRMSELNTTFAQTLPHAATTYIACYGVAFAPATVQTQQGGFSFSFFGLHLPCRGLVERLPFTLFLLPLGMMQSLAGLLRRFLLSVVPSTDANVSDMLMLIRTHPKPTALSAAAGAQFTCFTSTAMYVCMYVCMYVYTYIYK